MDLCDVCYACEHYYTNRHCLECGNLLAKMYGLLNRVEWIESILYKTQKDLAQPDKYTVNYIKRAFEQQKDFIIRHSECEQNLKIVCDKILALEKSGEINFILNKKYIE